MMYASRPYVHRPDSAMVSFPITLAIVLQHDEL
jgi:hypothetical protein